MDIIILGAGEVGKQLASTLNEQRNNIVVVDLSAELIAKVQDRLDVMAILGDCANFDVLKKAGVRNADILIATTGNDASNIIACRVAKHFKVAKTICRLSSRGFFSEEDGFGPEASGIDQLIFPEDECVAKIVGALGHESVVERFGFRAPNAEMTAVRIPPNSPLAGMPICDFPDPGLLANIRFSAIIRDGKLFMPHGDTVFTPHDEVYIAGGTENVAELIGWVDPESAPIKDVIVAGASRIGVNLVVKLMAAGFKVRLVEGDAKVCERVLEQGSSDLMIINGDPTDGDALDDAGVDACDAFVSAMRDDEDNILSCVLAKQLGARKVVSVTNKAEYMDIVPSMKAIDCGFSPRLVAVNSVLNSLGNDTVRVHAILHRAHASVYEFDVNPGSKVANKKISEFERSLPAILSLVFRDGKMLPATGDLVLLPGDHVAAVTTPQTLKTLEPLFRKRGFLGL